MATTADAQGALADRRYPAAIEGCWEADRVLMAQLDDISQVRAGRLLILSPGGGVGRPLLSEREAQRMWEPRSAWKVVGDSVLLRVFTGLVGWDAHLVLSRDGGRLQGRARYLSDAIVPGRAPDSVSLSLGRVLCDPGWRRPDTSANHAARREGTVWFASQVTRAAALRSATALPARLRRVDVLGDHEENAGWEPLVQRVARAAEPLAVVSVVIEADGRIHPSSVNVRKASPSMTSALLATVPALLGQVRFTPAQRKGEPVGVLALLTVELTPP
jgi:hypothetical protein